MAEDPLAAIPAHERLSFRAVLVHGDADATAALHAAGIYDPVTLPVTLGTQAPPASGTPGMTAVLQTQQAKQAAASEPAPAASGPPASATRSRHGVHAAVSSRTGWEAGGASAVNPVTGRAGILRSLVPAPGESTQPHRRTTRIKPHLLKLTPGWRSKTAGAAGGSSAGQRDEQLGSSPTSETEQGAD